MDRHAVASCEDVCRSCGRSTCKAAAINLSEPSCAARDVVGTAGAGEVALADEPLLDPASCAVAAFELVTMMNWYMRCGVHGKVDQIIARALRCRLIPKATHSRRGVKAAGP